MELLFYNKMFFLPFLIGAAIIGTGAYVVSQVFQIKKHINSKQDVKYAVNESLKACLKSDTTYKVDVDIYSNDFTIVGCDANNVDVNVGNNEIIRIEALSVSKKIKPGMKC